MNDGFIKVASATPKVRVCDVDFNSDEIIKLMDEANSKRVKVLVFPELSITGYTCGDLFAQDMLLDGARSALDKVVLASKGKKMLVFVGYPHMHMGKLYNTAAAIFDGRILALVAKENLPNYGEFYEARWFTPSPEENVETEILGFKVPLGKKILFSDERIKDFVVSAEICEDLWVPIPPSVYSAFSGANIIVNLSASNELVGKDRYRLDLVKAHSARILSAYVYSDAGEGESTTDLVFTGSDIIAENGSVLSSASVSDGMIITEVDVERLARAKAKVNTFKCSSDGFVSIPFKTDIEETELTRKFSPMPFVPSDDEERRERMDKIITLQAMGLKRRLEHIRASSVVIGLSGGLDSTLALLVAVKAYDMLKMDRKGIIAVTMPCFGTTKRTRSNAEILASELGVSFMEIDIKKSVTQHFEDIGQSMDKHDVTFENGQARERTQVLMDLANKFNAIVIGTGDLSELALGWATFNGDHASMYGVNGSIPKTLVRYIVSNYADSSEEGVKSVLYDILATPVSPELLPAKDGVISQVTEDLVGPYELHDFFLYYMVRLSYRPRKIYRIALDTFKDKYDRITIKKWLTVFTRRFFSQQFKRNFLPDGPKVGTVALSPRGDWRMPSDAVGSLWIKEAESLEV